MSPKQRMNARRRINDAVICVDTYVSTDLAKPFNEADHPRVPKGAKGGGQFTKAETMAWLGRHPIAAKNVVDMWDQATPGEQESGEVWYANAHKLATALGKRYGVGTRAAAGLLAAYSPQTPWGQNVQNAGETLRERRPLGGPKERIYFHHDPTTPNDFEEAEGVMVPGYVKKRAARIMAGEDPEEVFAGGRLKSGALKPSSLKIRAFSALIAHGTQPDPDNPRVVIDRHAAGVARGVRFTDDDYEFDSPSGTATKFETYSKAYAEAAKIISEKLGRKVTPEMVQAVTWLTRQRLNGLQTGARGKGRKTQGIADIVETDGYLQQYLPEARDFLPKVGYSDLSNIDLSAPQFDSSGSGERWVVYTRRDGTQARVLVPRLQRLRSGEKEGPDGIVTRDGVPTGWLQKRLTPKVKLRVPVSAEETVRRIAKIMLSHRREKITPAMEAALIRRSLTPHGIELPAIQATLSLIRREDGSYRATAHAPNARLEGYWATLKGVVKDFRNSEVYYRAAYVANAAQRIQDAINEGEDIGEALEHERPFFEAHERARRGRMDSAAQVQIAAAMFGYEDERGTLLGWYLNPLLNNDVECIQANGHNFYMEEGTVIGLPGSVHPNCGCYAGQPIWGADLVNDVMNVHVLHKTRAKFKARERKAS